MSGLASFMPDFGAAQSDRTAGPAIDDAVLEAREAKAYEQGYRAGWSDAVDAQSADGKRLTAEVAQNLRDLSFTYHEAYSHVLRAMTPLLEDIVDKVVPAALGDGLAAHVVSELQARAGTLGAMSVTIAVAPEQLPLVEPLVLRDVGFAVDVIADGALSEGQADIRLADSEERIDLSDIADGIRAAVATLANAGTLTSEGRFAHG
ncbi:ABC transporter ATP-binding protein [Roseivivax halodurans JCM 10272]|uniref:ABC transporter ATP-binding protein n=1 Tax=Roseivivax halodurans JCM 10272 TaxID=1449350 RepID=X7EIP3_9RHOB|nr:hypothetical protein [Roseivivax halodurans]ETX15013.1 ABC transporter ATP-binding protein [Roseivivax halodurans JCM 10272]